MFPSQRVWRPERDVVPRARDSTLPPFVRPLQRIGTDAMRLSTIFSIYQAGEPLCQHLDKV
jgi:hypothetical protein